MRFLGYTLLLFLGQVFDVVNEEKYLQKFLKLLRVTDGYQLSSLSTVELKKQKSMWIELKFPSLNPKDDSFHSYLSRRLHYCCVGFARFQKAQ
jgi:hypothetical protein